MKLPKPSAAASLLRSRVQVYSNVHGSAIRPMGIDFGGVADWKGVYSLLSTLSTQNQSVKAQQIEEVARSTNKRRKITVTPVGGHALHTHPPALATTTWITIEMVDGYNTPETIHIYAQALDDGKTYILNPAADANVGKVAGSTISVENTLTNGLVWS